MAPEVKIGKSVVSFALVCQRLDRSSDIPGAVGDRGGERWVVILLSGWSELSPPFFTDNLPYHAPPFSYSERSGS